MRNKKRAPAGLKRFLYRNLPVEPVPCHSRGPGWSNMKKLIILSVVHSPELQARLQEDFQTYLGGKFDCRFAGTTQAALELSLTLLNEGLEIAVVVTELNLPDIKGDELLIRLQDQFPDTNKILLTDTPQFETVHRLMNHITLYAYFTHPIDYGLVVKKVEKAAYGFLHNYEIHEHSRLFRSLNKATQEIASEIDLPRIINKLMTYSIENTRASRAFLLFSNQGKLVIDAVASSDRDESRQLRKRLSEEPEALNAEVLDLVTLTLERQVFPDHKVVIPIYKKGKNIAYLYLENYDSQELFTHNQYEVLQVLAAQAAIAMENASLYGRIDERTRELTTQKERVEESVALLELKDRDLSGTLAYARTFQHAFRPSEEILSTVFPDSFVFLQPYSEIAHSSFWLTEKYYKFVLAVVEIPVYGVPAAFLTLVVHSLLNEITSEFAVLEPDIVLETLYIRLNQILGLSPNPEALNAQVRIGLCVIDPSDQNIRFAGAGSSLILVRQNDVFEFPGHDTGLGYTPEPVLGIEAHLIPIEAHDTLYLYNTGMLTLLDEDHQPLKAKLRLYQLFRELNGFTLARQRETLEQTFGPEAAQHILQDILLIGLKNNAPHEL